MKPARCKKAQRRRRRQPAKGMTKSRSWSQIATEIYHVSPETQALIKKAVDRLSGK